MKLSSITLLVLFLFPISLHSQLTLETANGNNRNKFIRHGDKIGLQLPTKTLNNDCNCCHLTYIGFLDSLGADYIKINQLESKRVFVDEFGVNQFHNIKYESKAKVPTNIPINSLISVFVFPKSRKK